MAANTSKDQPPAYTTQDNQTSTATDRAEPSTSTVLKPNHSTRASVLSHATSQGEITTLEYLELTFSVMVVRDQYNDYEPVVLAINEDYNTLLKDMRHLFSATEIDAMKVIWGGTDSSQLGRNSPALNSGNITAMLRLLKSRNGVDGILAHQKY